MAAAKRTSHGRARRAVQEIERDIPLARRGEYGWTKKDAADLATIARGLRHYLKTDYQR